MNLYFNVISQNSNRFIVVLNKSVKVLPRNPSMLVVFVMLLAAVVVARPDDHYTDEQMTDMIKVGFGNVHRETINGEVTIESGTVPAWLNGNFMRHACGAFGETDHMNHSEPNYIDHLFDCLEIGSKYRLENGHVTFTNRWYDTVANDIYNYYGGNMNKSSVFMTGAFAKVNGSQVDKWAANFSQTSKVGDVPHVSWWKVGNEAVAMSEGPVGIVIDPNEVVQKGEIQYMDDNLGLPLDGRYMQTNNPAHEQTESDGTLWSTVGVVNFASQTKIKSWRIVYKVGADRVRIPVGEFHYGDTDLTRCHGNHPYPDMNARFGYLHSFAMTDNYIILPEASYMHDTCAYAHYNGHLGFFKQAFVDEPSGYSRLLVMRKSDGAFVANITAIPFFVTHQLGSYEDGELIHMDMLMYNNADIYTKYVFLSSIIGNDPYSTNVTRITINTTDWSYTMRNLRTGSPAAFEMSNINYAFYGKKYVYAYMVRNFDQQAQNALTKLNVDTGDEMEYVFPLGMYVQEPQFIPTPNAVFEDDGVLLAQGVDGRKHKGFMVVIDAKTMTLISHVTAPDISLFGIHERFFPLDVGKSTSVTGIVG